MKPYIAILIKPTLECNRSCRHCYHLPEERNSGNIPFQTLEKVFKLASEEYQSVWFIWHGGDPLLMPFSFYRRALDLQDKYFGKDSHRVGNTIQTNGINIDRRFLRLCEDRSINVGISYEGPYNDILRNMTAETGRSIEVMQKHGSKFSVSCTLSTETADKQPEIYRYFRDLGIAPSFSPVLPKGCAAIDPSMIPDTDIYIKGCIDAFDEWLFDKDAEVPLLPYYLYVLNALGKPAFADCPHTSCMGRWLCVYPNGDLYPCAKGCPSKYRMGNVSEIESISDAFSTDGFADILEGTVARRNECSSCEIYRYCAGGCSIDAECETGIEKNGGSSCKIFKAVFLHVKEEVDRILSERPDMSQYNMFVRDAVLGKLINPGIVNF